MKKIIIAALRGYKKAISPYKIKSCRFSPTCSEYAIEAFDKYGVLRGLALSVWRVLRCNPVSKGGYDPVPGKE
jgi:putative membrane protein insertion efficiency factor